MPTTQGMRDDNMLPGYLFRFKFGTNLPRIDLDLECELTLGQSIRTGNPDEYAVRTVNGNILDLSGAVVLVGYALSGRQICIDRIARFA